jgi:hypothetical protein
MGAAYIKWPLLPLSLNPFCQIEHCCCKAKIMCRGISRVVSLIS